MTSPVVRSGELLCYRLFDVGDKIALDEAEGLLARASVALARLDRKQHGALSFLAVPLRLKVSAQTLRLPGGAEPVEAEVVVHLYEEGNVAVLFRLPIAEGTALAALPPRCRELYESPLLTSLARKEVEALLPSIAGALHGRHAWAGHETYTVILLRSLAGDPPAREILAWEGLAKLLVGETSEHALGALHEAEILEHASSYLDNDLVVVDWNSALVVEPSGDEAMIDMLEYANVQLTGLRCYDDQIEEDLKLIYAEFAAVGGRGLARVLSSPYTQLAHKVFRRLVKITEMNEHTQNSIKLTGSFYMARVYRAAINRLRISAWQESIQQKQSIVAEVYAMLKNEAELRQSTALELTVIVLIVVEVILAFKDARH